MKACNAVLPVKPMPAAYGPYCYVLMRLIRPLLLLLSILPQVSWAKGSKKAALGGDDIRLPSLQAPDAVGQPVPFWVRFVGDPKEWPGAAA